MKKISFFLFILFVANHGFSQLEFKNSNVGRMLGFVDQNGHSLLKSYDPDVAGSPFINPDRMLAMITLSGGKVVGPLPIRLNIENNELYFTDSAGTELIALPAMVKKVDCINYRSKDSIRYVFKNGYPTIDQQNENYYYWVLTEGKIELVVKAYKYIRIEKNDLSGEVSKEFIEGSKLYVYANGTMQPFQPNKNFVATLMKDKEALVNTFIETNKINFKKTPDLVALLMYYNELKK